MKAIAMKSVLFFTIVSVSLITSVYSQGTCATDGLQLGGVGPLTPAGTGVNTLNPSLLPSNCQAGSNVAVRPSASQARITVVDADSAAQPQASSTNRPVSTARLTVVDDLPRQKPAAKVTDDTNRDDATAPTATESTTSTGSDDATISDALKGLAGTWKAVARRGDGELTTVELRLDDRGWAELTVPDAEGKPSTIKRRAELDGQNLKLSGPDAELLLGQLIEVNSRQMVLARAGGQVTFVRP
jgi:hypothetical protein